jgi:hypothetical protein
VRTLGQAASGDSSARFRAAYEVVRTLVTAGVPVLRGSPAVKLIEEQRERLSAAYLAHEYMGGGWCPLWFSQVRQAMAAIGLEPAGSADLIENYDSLVLGKSAREMLSRFTDDDIREMVREFFLTRMFRRDVYIREGRRLDEEERRRELLASRFALTRPPGTIKYSTTTIAGQVGYDNLAARVVVDGLAKGPRSIAEIATRSDIDTRDLLANALVLCGDNVVRPVESGCVSVTPLNRALWNRLGGQEPIQILALPCGTALRIDSDLLALLRDGGAIGDDKFAGWREFLASHDLSWSS